MGQNGKKAARPASAPEARPPRIHVRKRPPVSEVPPQEPSRTGRGRLLEIQEAEWAFVREGRSLAEIAQAHGRPYRTIQQWAQAGLWEAARRQFLLSDQGQADILQEELRKVLLDVQRGIRPLTAPLAHMILVTSRAAKEMRGDRYSVSAVFAVMKDFLRHIRAAQPDLLDHLEPHVEAFLKAMRTDLLPKGPPARKG
ncbi:MAG: hypothetical protein AB1824_01340 [Acidobacteriota bacterium]